MTAAPFRVSTPEEQPPVDCCIRQVAIPNSEEYKSLVTSVLALLTNPLTFIQRNPEDLTPEDAAQVFTEMYLDYLGELKDMLGAIIPMATDVLPDNMLWCDGTQYARADYPDLYGRLDSVFIVDADNFIVPNLNNDVFIVGAGGSIDVGDTGGEATHVLTTDEMPPHWHSTHQHLTAPVVAPGEVPVNIPSAIPTTTGTTGTGLAHNNMPPYFGLKFAIIVKSRGTC